MLLAYGETTVRVESGDRASLSWLREFLMPAFSEVEGSAANCSVELIMDDPTYAGILAAGQRVSRQIASFALERGTIRLPLWAATPHERILYDAVARVFYGVGNEGARVRVISAAHHLAARFAFMRVVREFAMSAAQAARGLLIHGAAFAAAGEGIILAGAKAAGKTSLLIHALRSGGAQFVSNDRVVVYHGDTQPVLRGMPTVVTIRPQTLTLFPDLRTSLLRSGYDHRLALGEAAPAGARLALPKPDRPIDLSPFQFCQLLGVEMCGHSPLRALVFPTLAAACEGIRVRRLSVPAATERLSEALFGMESPGTTSEVFAAQESPPIDPDRLRAWSSTVLERVPALECQLGTRAYQRGNSLAELINRELAS